MIKLKRIFLIPIVVLSLIAVSGVAFAETVPSGDSGSGNKAVSNYTGDASDMQVVLCNAMNFVTGGVGKTIASFIIIGVGITFFTGKASWGLMIGVALGVSAMFGAPAIINAVTGDTTNFCNKTAV